MRSDKLLIGYTILTFIGITLLLIAIPMSSDNLSYMEMTMMSIAGLASYAACVIAIIVWHETKELFR